MTWVIEVDGDALLADGTFGKRKVCRYRTLAAAKLELRHTAFAGRPGFAPKQMSDREIDAYERMINGGPPVRKRLSKERE